MEKTIKRFKKFSEKGYKHYTENTTEELDNLSLDNPDIITEFAHLCEWLRVNHGIWIYVDTHEFGKWCFNYKIIKPNKDYPRINVNGEFGLEDYNSPQEAYSAAFDYVLKELI